MHSTTCTAVFLSWFLAICTIVQGGTNSVLLGAAAATTDNPDNSGSHNHNNNATQRYSCPTALTTTAENDHFDDYWATYETMNERNLQDLQGFRNRGYDWRRASYTKMKRDTAPFKRAYFGNVVQSGDHIYESASGQGLNLLMTVENLYEQDGVANLTLHGNDYLEQSVAVAHRLYDQEAQPWFDVGHVCPGDSTNLRHVPDNTFDLAYTGFIDPIMDPLNLLGEHATMELTESLIAHLCQSQDELHQELAQLAQERQEDWHAKWVSELLRIVKPGKFVVVEDLGWPACTEITDWAGLDPDWWPRAIEKYKWPVDPKSIAIVKYAWYVDRYNVRLQKLPDDNDNANDILDAEQLNRESAQLYDQYKQEWKKENGRAEDEEEWDEDEEEWDEDDEEEEDEDGSKGEL